MTRNDRLLTVEQLRGRILDGSLDTVILAFTDMQGRLIGKRISSRLFVDEVGAQGQPGDR